MENAAVPGKDAERYSSADPWGNIADLPIGGSHLLPYDQYLQIRDKALQLEGRRRFDQMLDRFAATVPVNDDLIRFCLGKGLIGAGSSFKKLLIDIRDCSECDSPVLLTGETGTGKEIVTDCIQALSHRKDKPFLKVNCAGIPETLLEAELFGYVRGAFTGAVNNMPGKFEVADEGTIFLDEIGDMPQSMQAKILRVLNDGSVLRVGGNKESKVDVRVITATNRDLSKAIQEGRFRSDLYYRVATMEVHLDALRSRQGDIPLLMTHLIERYSTKANLSVRGVSKFFLLQAIYYLWPGNIRELAMLIERACNRVKWSSSSYLINFDEKVGWPFSDNHYVSIPKRDDGIHRLVEDKIDLNRLPHTDMQRLLKQHDRLLKRAYKGLWDYESWSQSLGTSEVGFDMWDQLTNYNIKQVQREYYQRQFEKHGRNLKTAGEAAGVSGATVKKWIKTK
jgi:transcriptional regulator with PAS, ATPase and Fis domain